MCIIIDSMEIAINELKTRLYESSRLESLPFRVEDDAYKILDRGRRNLRKGGSRMGPSKSISILGVYEIAYIHEYNQKPFPPGISAVQQRESYVTHGYVNASGCRCSATSLWWSWVGWRVIKVGWRARERQYGGRTVRPVSLYTRMCVRRNEQRASRVRVQSKRRATEKDRGRVRGREKERERVERGADGLEGWRDMGW